MAKSLNPMDAFRREQKKKELKKHRVERQKEKQAKLGTMDVDELREQLKKLERQVQMNPTDGPTRKRKQELEDTLNKVVKKKKEIEMEKQQQQAEQKAPMTLKDLTAANAERYQNPENSIYYHPTLNPFGAPPPGKPQMYRVPPPSMQLPMRPPAPRPSHPRGPPMRGSGGPPRFQGNRLAPTPPRPPEIIKRPGKRPPLPPGPPPPGTIQVPPQPPLPQGAIPFRPPPPPSSNSRSGIPPPPPPPPQTLAPVPSSSQAPLLPQTTGEEVQEFDEHESYAIRESADAIVAPYPPPPPIYDDYGQEEEHIYRASIEDEDEDEEENKSKLRSLVPVALRVQRSGGSSRSQIPSAPAPRPVVPAPSASIIMAPVPRPPTAMVLPPPLTTAPKSAVNEQLPSNSGSVSKEFDAFMEEMKDLL